MRNELQRAYPALKRQWEPHGKVFRRDGVRGEPDFMLTANAWPRIPAYVEVKAKAQIGIDTGLSYLQAAHLDELAGVHLLARLLIYNVNHDLWHVSDGPFLSIHGRVKSAKDLLWRTRKELDPDFFMWSEFLQ